MSFDFAQGDITITIVRLSEVEALRTVCPCEERSNLTIMSNVPIASAVASFLAMTGTHKKRFNFIKVKPFLNIIFSF
ncbi:hypothetical protein FLAPXU55_03063 [Flavobacterium panici]|uniref:Uncharacterized protein n=1 Tax=Flavobacterium panici TaxID=2654843 RepID=A0A9N8J2Y6_9FLAO|nr:hypothetical protein FLAPXU55_03063 [Flavobacterium panici]